MGKKYFPLCSVVLFLSLPLISLNTVLYASKESSTSIQRINSSSYGSLTPDTQNIDYLVAAEGTAFYVIIESEQMYEAYTEYFVNVTVQVDSWGTWTDRLYDMYFSLSLVWSGGHWNSTFRNIPEINTIGGYNFTIFGIALNEGDFGSLANNEEVPMTLYYYLEVTEGVILGPDITSYGQLDVFGVTYRNVEATPTGGIYDVVLPPVYSDYETKMGVSIKTNSLWLTDEIYTIFVTVSAL